MFTQLRHGRGFTLVEIMIVVAIIALLAAIAIPNLLRARLNANENATVSNLQTASAQLQSFAGRNIIVGVPSYPAAISALCNLAAGGTIPDTRPPYLDDTWAAAPINKAGYTYAYTAIAGAGAAAGANVQFFLTAIPIQYETTGVRSFYIDEKGVVYGGDAAGAALAAHGTPGAPYAVVQ